jgi:hypothetical protein
MSNSSRMSVMYCPWSMVSIRLGRSRSIMHPSSHEEGPRSSIWKREEKFFLKVMMNEPCLPTRMQSLLVNVDYQYVEKGVVQDGPMV